MFTNGERMGACSCRTNINFVRAMEQEIFPWKHHGVRGDQLGYSTATQVAMPGRPAYSTHQGRSQLIAANAGVQKRRSTPEKNLSL